jgi:hypothetical protein
MQWFDDLQRAQLAQLEEINLGSAALVRQNDAVYLFGTIGSEAVLLRDGRVRIWSADEWPDSEEYSERIATPTERIESLVLGAERYPQLQELLPQRPDDARDCTRCGGAGRLSADSGVLCPTCHGLGWQPPAI